MKRVFLILAALAAWTAAAATPNRTATEAFVTNKIAAGVAALSNAVDYKRGDFDLAIYKQVWKVQVGIVANPPQVFDDSFVWASGNTWQTYRAADMPSLASSYRLTYAGGTWSFKYLAGGASRTATTNAPLSADYLVFGGASSGWVAALTATNRMARGDLLVGASDLAAVATSGSYNDLDDRPTIPTKVSAFANDAGYLTQHQSLEPATNYTDSATNALSVVAHTGAYSDLTGTPTIPTVPTNVSAFSNDVGYITQHQSLDGYATTNALAEQKIISQRWQTSVNGQLMYYTALHRGNILSPSLISVWDWALQQYKPTYGYQELTNTPPLAAVATSGSYSDLSGAPTIPATPADIGAASTNEVVALTIRIDALEAALAGLESALHLLNTGTNLVSEASE